jgi:NADH-ubiquinone oxidoreductase chain 2
MPKISILILLLQIYTQGLNLELGLITIENFNGIEILNNFTEVKILLLISSLISLILGTIVGLAQTRIKRLLAYSTISHIGFILLALAISTEQSIEALFFYIIQYSITNLNTFLILIALSYLIYNSALQINLYKIIKNNYYFTIIFVSLQIIKSKTLFLDLLKVENLIKVLPEFIYTSKYFIFNN